MRLLVKILCGFAGFFIFISEKSFADEVLLKGRDSFLGIVSISPEDKYGAFSDYMISNPNNPSDNPDATAKVHIEIFASGQYSVPVYSRDIFIPPVETVGVSLSTVALETGTYKEGGGYRAYEILISWEYIHHPEQPYIQRLLPTVTSQLMYVTKNDQVVELNNLPGQSLIQKKDKRYTDDYLPYRGTNPTSLKGIFAAYTQSHSAKGEFPEGFIKRRAALNVFNPTPKGSLVKPQAQVKKAQAHVKLVAAVYRNKILEDDGIIFRLTEPYHIDPSIGDMKGDFILYPQEFSIAMFIARVVGHLQDNGVIPQEITYLAHLLIKGEWEYEIEPEDVEKLALPLQAFISMDVDVFSSSESAFGFWDLKNISP